jgi:hypothetical protein
MPSLEARPEHTPSPDPPEAEDAEPLFAAAVRSAVNELFARQPVAEKLQGIEGNEQIEALVGRWKHTLVQQFEQTAEAVMTQFLTALDTFQAQGPAEETEPSLPLFPLAAVPEARQNDPLAAWNKPFLISSVCRADLKGIIPDEDIARLDDADMERIADKMSDAHRDSGGYWEALEIMVQALLERRAQQAQAGETPG